VTRSVWWFSQTFHLDFTNARAISSRRRWSGALQQKVTKADGFADASDAQTPKLNTQEAGYEAQRNAAGARSNQARAVTRR